MSRICNITSNGFIVDPACLPVLTVNWEIYDVTNGISLETIQVAPSTSMAGADSYGFFVGGTGEEPSFDLCALDTTTTQIELRGSITDSCQKTSEPCVFTYDIPISAEAVDADRGTVNDLNQLANNVSDNDTPCSYGATTYQLIGTPTNGTVDSFDTSTGAYTFTPAGAGVWLFEYGIYCDGVLIDQAREFGEVVIAPPETRFTFDGNSSDESEFVNSGAGGEYLDTFEFIKSGSTDPLDAGFTGTLELKLGGDTYSAPYTDGDSLSGLTFTGPDATTAAEITNHLTGTVANGSNLLFSTWDFLNAIGTDVPNNGDPVDIDWCINVLDIYGQGQVNTDNTASMPFECGEPDYSLNRPVTLDCSIPGFQFNYLSIGSLVAGNVININKADVYKKDGTPYSLNNNLPAVIDMEGALMFADAFNDDEYEYYTRLELSDNLGCGCVAHVYNTSNLTSFTACPNSDAANGLIFEQIINNQSAFWNAISKDNPCAWRTHIEENVSNHTGPYVGNIRIAFLLMTIGDNPPSGMSMLLEYFDGTNWVVDTSSTETEWGNGVGNKNGLGYVSGDQVRLSISFNSPECGLITDVQTHTLT